MCVSVSPRVPVHFSNTVLYAAEVEVEGQARHVLGYQNSVQNGLANGAPAVAPEWVLRRWFGRRLDPVPGPGNVMILPFPAVPGTMTAANVLDTSRCRRILQDMAIHLMPPPEPVSRAVHAAGPSAPRIQVFPAAGIYTVVLAQDARDIPAALDQVTEAKRPALNQDLFDAYARWYPEWTIALCCFNNREARLADPMLWWYAPMVPDELFLPTLDCHTGDVPDLERHVNVDHTFAVGSLRMPAGSWPVPYHNGTPVAMTPVRYRDRIPVAVAPYVRRHVIGAPYRRLMENGDVVCRLADVRERRFDPIRRRPPAA